MKRILKFGHKGFVLIHTLILLIVVSTFIMESSLKHALNLKSQEQIKNAYLLLEEEKQLVRFIRQGIYNDELYEHYYSTQQNAVLSISVDIETFIIKSYNYVVK